MHETELFENKFFKVTYNTVRKVLICRTLSGFIPSKEFKITFEEMTKLVRQIDLKTMIFDKRSLRTFDQASMTWYHVEWKPQMAKLGLRQHRKILPQDIVFQTSVKVGRTKIQKEHPDFRFEDYDIKYCESMDEALEIN